MSIRSRQEEGPAPAMVPMEAPVWAVVATVAIVVAAWIAAGSMGVLAEPLQRALTWVALLTAVAAGVPRQGCNWPKGLGLAAAVLVGLLMTAAQSPETPILAVALVGAALAWTHDHLPRRILLLAVIAVTILAIFRIALGAVGWLWLAVDACTGILASLAGKLAGQPLDVGATYGGLDILVVMVVVYVGWLQSTPQPRLRRGLIVAGVIVAGHLLYLMLLAHTESLRAMLPEVVRPPEADRDILGIWTWGNAVHGLLPWNMPLLAMLIHGVILATVLRWTAWLPEEAHVGTNAQQKHRHDEPLTGSALLADLATEFGPFVLAVLLPLVGWLAPGASDLKGKTFVAYNQAHSDWLLPTHEDLGVQTDGALGTLPALVERLGGTWVMSEDLSAADLERADVVLLAHPDRPWQDGQLERLGEYVRG
ncbi:MAG: hypothetical protein U1E05_14210, partial [Patescibacteria group bacterium]|nr:hypothetical protein [Patescibacteria group bacterium]